jgi:hypothetical protein
MVNFLAKRAYGCLMSALAIDLRSTAGFRRRRQGTIVGRVEPMYGSSQRLPMPSPSARLFAPASSVPAESIEQIDSGTRSSASASSGRSRPSSGLGGTRERRPRRAHGWVEHAPAADGRRDSGLPAGDRVTGAVGADRTLADGFVADREVRRAVVGPETETAAPRADRLATWADRTV